jgi:putative ABC transport system permease protein
MYLTALQQGLQFSLLALGVYISFRILNIPDLTVEGSFVLGMTTAVMTSGKVSPLLCLLIAFLSGSLAGLFTGFLQVKVKIHPILAGILTGTGLYTINLFVLNGIPNVTIFNNITVFNAFSNWFASMALPYSRTLLLIIFAILSVIITAVFFKTRLGLSIRAVGDNESMVKSSSINSGLVKCIALALSNGLVGLSGGIVSQFHGLADIYYGSGMVVVGLASVIIGEAIFGKRSVTLGLISSAIGCVLYYLIIGIAYNFNLPSYSIKLISALIVIFALSIPTIKTSLYEFKIKREARKNANLK